MISQAHYSFNVTMLDKILPHEMTEIDKVVFKMLEKNIPFIDDAKYKDHLIYFVEKNTTNDIKRYEIQYYNKSNSKVECVTKFLDAELRSSIVQSIRKKKLNRIDEI